VLVLAKVIARVVGNVSRVVCLLGGQLAESFAFSRIVGSLDDIKLLQVADDIVFEVCLVYFSLVLLLVKFVNDFLVFSSLNSFLLFSN
jgi:hypothetical protein